MKRKLACFCGAFALAELAAAYLPPLALLLTAAVFVFAAILCVVRKDIFLHRAAAVFCGLAVGALWFVLFQSLVPGQLHQYAGSTANCIVTIETDRGSSYEDEMLSGTLHITELDGVPVDFKVYCSSFPGLEAGERFSARFSFELLPESSYRMARFAKTIFLSADYEGNYRALGNDKSPAFLLYRLRQALSQRLRRYLPNEISAMESAMLLGDKSSLSDAVTDIFRTAGVAHLLSVSGLHVALLCGLLTLGVANRQKRRFSRIHILGQGALLLLYILLTGAPVSVIRAGIIVIVALVGDAFLQPPDTLTSLGIAALIMGLQNAYAPCDVGFQLSFCGVLGVQAAAALTKIERNEWNAICSKKAIGDKTKLNVPRILPTAAEKLFLGIQSAALATLATLPVLLAHGLATSGVAVLTNLLVVWMLRYALLFGLPVLAFSAIPALDPFYHLASLVLGAWLKLMYGIISGCANLPWAHLKLPRGYTLYVLFCLAILVILFYYYRRLIIYLPVFICCVSIAFYAGKMMQKDVVSICMVGVKGNPCLVIEAESSVSVLFRGGAANKKAVTQYLKESGLPCIDTLIDLRQQPTNDAPPAEQTFLMTSLEEAEASCRLANNVSADLYHSTGGNMVVLDVGGCHIAVSAGTVTVQQPVTVDFYCAASGCPKAIRPANIIHTAKNISGLSALERLSLYYGEQPTLLIRPGKSYLVKGAEKSVIQ